MGSKDWLVRPSLGCGSYSWSNPQLGICSRLPSSPGAASAPQEELFLELIHLWVGEEPGTHQNTQPILVLLIYILSHLQDPPSLETQNWLGVGWRRASF